MNNAAELELELTYLAKELPKELKGVQPQRVLDVYIPDTTDHSHLRLRQKGDKFYITKKTQVNDDASIHLEQTIEISEQEFLCLIKSSKKRVVKDRYIAKIAGRTAEVDVFREELQGLVLIDFEFETEQEKASFVAPEVALADVTQEDFIAGGVLAGKKYEDLLEKLNEFSYQKI